VTKRRRRRLRSTTPFVSSNVIYTRIHAQEHKGREKIYKLVHVPRNDAARQRGGHAIDDLRALSERVRNELADGLERLVKRLR
jgi:adenylosuccinate lyase